MTYSTEALIDLVVFWFTLAIIIYYFGYVLGRYGLTDTRSRRKLKKVAKPDVDDMRAAADGISTVWMHANRMCSHCGAKRVPVDQVGKPWRVCEACAENPERGYVNKGPEAIPSEVRSP